MGSPHRLQQAVFVSLVASVGAMSLAAGVGALLNPRPAVRIAPPPGALAFGASVAVLGDVNGDQTPDLAVGAPGSGHAYVVSGATRTILRTIVDPAGSGFAFGFAVAAVGDVDRDGVADLAVGAPSHANPTKGRAVVFSGATGAVLRTLVPATAGHLAFGHSVAASGDLSGDGTPDIVVTAPGLDHGVGTAFAFSGADGVQLWSRADPMAASNVRSSFGQSAVATPDVSGDGVVDLLVSAPAGSTAPQPAPSGGDLVTGLLTGVVGLVTAVVRPQSTGRVHLVSGRDGTVLRSIADPVPGAGDGFGVATAAMGDQDGDGVTDHLVAESGSNQLHLYSGAHGRLIRSMGVPGPPPAPGPIALAQAGDEDGDGRNDVWVGVPSARSAYLVNAMGTELAASAAPSAQGSFGAAVAALPRPLGGDGGEAVVGDPTEPGGGATYYLLQTGVRAATVAAVAPEPRVQAQAPPVTTAVPTTVATTAVPDTTTVPPTTLPLEATGPTATLPKPASAVTADAALADTGGVDRSLVGLAALALALVGLTAVRPHRERAPRGEPSAG